jgi:ribonuclease P/MRP protein subunit RPP1
LHSFLFRNLLKHDAILCHLFITRSLISKALRKKYFYKETIKIDRLLPNEQLDSTKYKLSDWIGWDPSSLKGDLQSLETNLEPSPNKHKLLGSSPINYHTKVLHEKGCDADVSLFAERLEQSTSDSAMPVETQEETLQANGSEAHDATSHTSLEKSENNEIVMAHNAQACVASSVDKKCTDEYVLDAMELDATEPCTSNLIAGDSDPLSCDVKLSCSSLPQSMELSDTMLEDKGPDQASDIVDCARADATCGTSCTSGEMEDQAPLDHNILSCSDVCLGNKGLDKPDGIPVDSKDHGGTAESVWCSPGGGDDETLLNPAGLLSTDLWKDIILPIQQVMEDKIEQKVDENIEHTMAEPVDKNARGMISVENNAYSQETSSDASVCDKGSSDETKEKYELKEQNSKKPIACLEKDAAKIHGEPLKFPCAVSKVEISTARSGDMIYSSLISLLV